MFQNIPEVSVLMVIRIFEVYLLSFMFKLVDFIMNTVVIFYEEYISNIIKLRSCQ